MDFKKLAEERYSCRMLSERKVKKELLQQIVDTAIKSPTAVNKQPYKIFLMESEDAKENIHRATSCTFGAKSFMVVGGKKDDAWVRTFDNRNFADVDASIVATHIMMQIHDLGLATTWVGHFDAPFLKEQYPEMRDYDLIALFPIGYSAEGGQPSVRHFERKSQEEVLEVL